MSYYVADYFKNPMPYYDGPSASRTVPGWGQLPRSAGNARIGVGAEPLKVPFDRLKMMAVVDDTSDSGSKTTDETTDDSLFRKVPWWVWMAAPGVLAGGLALSVNMGWIGSEK